MTLYTDVKTISILVNQVSIHINGVGGDCPDKTEIALNVFLQSDILVYQHQKKLRGEL